LILFLLFSDSTDKNKPYHEAIKGNKEPLREQVNFFNEEFLSMIETNRAGKLKADRKEWGTGKEYFADHGIELGLIDNIDTLENVLNYFNT